MPTAAELSSFLGEARADMAGLFTDACRITRAATADDAAYVDTSAIDESTGQYPAQGRVTVYEGPCRLQVKADINSNVLETTAGEREWTYLTGQLQLPVLTPTGHDAYVSGDPGEVDVDNVCEWTEAPFDPSMVGTFFNIQGPYRKSHSAYRRLRVREVAA